MRLTAPRQGTDFRTRDIYGKPFQLSELLGNRIMLSFFRDAACPFCNLRIYELTHQYKSWQDRGLEIVTVFSSPDHEVKAHVARHPRPFRMISDPELTLYNQYGVEHSSSAVLKAFLFNAVRIVRGIAKGGRFRKNPHATIVPADFLLEEDGRITQIWYARNTSDHIPLSAIDAFIDQGRPQRQQSDIANLQREIRQLRQEIGQLQKDGSE